MGSHGRKASCYMGSRSPYLKGQFWWIGAPVVNYRHLLPLAVHKRPKWLICRLGCGLKWAEGCTCLIVFARWRHCAVMGGHVAIGHLSNNIEPSIYDCDTPYVKLLWPSVIFGHSHRQPSASSWILYGGHSTECSHLVKSCRCRRVKMVMALNVIYLADALIEVGWSSTIEATVHRWNCIHSGRCNQWRLRTSKVMCWECLRENTSSVRWQRWGLSADDLSQHCAAVVD